MLTPEEAWRRLSPCLSPLPSEEILRRHATGRVLSQDLAATVHVPHCDVSAMDGYALGGPVSAGARLPVQGMVAAGDPPNQRLDKDAALRIMTGAPVPQGADRIVPVEDTDGGTEEVLVRTEVTPGAHVRRQGEIARVGQPVLFKGCLLMPGTLALAATHGYPALSVVRRPTVAVLTTGDELVSPETEPEPGQLRDSHTDFLCSAGRSLGLEVHELGIAPDRPDVLRERIRQGLAKDLLLVSGGSSMGELDLVEGVLGELGCSILFESVAIQPGKPLVVARHSRGLVFGLPGNPASAMVSFWLFVRPTIRRLMGLEDSFWYGALRGRLESTLPGAKSRDRFLPAEARFEGGEILVRPFQPKGSHDVHAYARGTALVRVPRNSPETRPGAACEVLPLSDWRVARPHNA